MEAYGRYCSVIHSTNIPGGLPGCWAQIYVNKRDKNLYSKITVTPTIVETDYNQHRLKLSELSGQKMKTRCKKKKNTEQVPQDWENGGDGSALSFKKDDLDMPNLAGST